MIIINVFVKMAITMISLIKNLNAKRVTQCAKRVLMEMIV
jgi:hypothetical protein